MLYKYKLLKSSWGIVIFLDMDEILSPSIFDTDIELSDKIYLRISDASKLHREIILKWIGSGIRTLSKEIIEKINGENVCYDIKGIDFNHSDFQEEGLYCVAQEWISQYYKIPLHPIDVKYDKELNKYIFDISKMI